MKIKVTNYGFVHYYAQCSDCDWDCGIRTKGAHGCSDVRNEIRKHVIKTGHTVHLESGKSIKYSLIQEFPQEET